MVLLGGSVDGGRRAAAAIGATPILRHARAQVGRERVDSQRSTPRERSSAVGTTRVLPLPGSLRPGRLRRWTHRLRASAPVVRGAARSDRHPGVRTAAPPPRRPRAPPPRQRGRDRRRRSARDRCPDLAVATGDDPAANTRLAVEMLGGMGRFVKRGRPRRHQAQHPHGARTAVRRDHQPGGRRRGREMCWDAGAKSVTVFDHPPRPHARRTPSAASRTRCARPTGT